MINRKKVIKIFFILNKFITFIICLKNYTNNLFKKKYRPLIHNDL